METLSCKIEVVELDNPQQINTQRKQKEIEDLILKGCKQRDICLLCHYVSGTNYEEELEKLRRLCNKYQMKHFSYQGIYKTYI